MRRLRTFAGVSAATLCSVLLAAAPAAAAPDWDTITHTTTDGVVAENGATATVEATGLRFVTAATTVETGTVRVDFRDRLLDPEVLIEFAEDIDEDGDLDNPALLDEIGHLVPLLFVEEMTYKTIKYDTDGGVDLLPSYRLEFFCDPDHPYTELSFEPRLQTPTPSTADFHDWKLWNVLEGSFWSSEDIGFGAGPEHSQSIDGILEYCEGGLIISFGAGQGPHDAKADGAVDEVRLAGLEIDLDSQVPTDEGPVVDIFKGKGLQALSGDEEESEDPDIFNPIARSHIWRAPEEPELPTTGSSLTTYVAVGTGLVLLGAVAVVISRRRRTGAPTS